MKASHLKSLRIAGRHALSVRMSNAFKRLSFRHVVLVAVLMLMLLSMISGRGRQSQSPFQIQRTQNRKATIHRKMGLFMDSLALRNENLLWPLEDVELTSLRHALRMKKESSAPQNVQRHQEGASDAMDPIVEDLEGVRAYQRPLEEADNDAGDAALKNRALNALSIFVSIVSYRDALCPYTLRSLFSQALNPGTVFVGLIEQHDIDLGDTLCVADQLSSVVFAPSAHRVSPVEGVAFAAHGNNFNTTSKSKGNDTQKTNPNDLERIQVELVHAHLKVMRVPPRLSKGPAFARYLAAQLYGGENYFLMIDSHMTFRLHWDRVVIRMFMQIDMEQELAGDGSINGPILSQHPPAWLRGSQSSLADPEAAALLLDTASQQNSQHPIQPIPSASPENQTINYLCLALFERPEFGFPILHSTVQVVDSLRSHLHRATNSRRKHELMQPFVAAGFLFSSSALLREAPFDPHLEYLFHGEEILLSARLWTSGFDFYAPTVDIAWHYYYRREAPKYFNDAQVLPTTGITNNLESEDDTRHAAYLRSIQRVQYLLQIPKYTPPWERVTKDPGEPFIPERLIRDEDPSVDRRVTADAEWYGMGTERPLRSFWEHAGIDIVNRKQDRRPWCCYPTGWFCTPKDDE